MRLIDADELEKVKFHPLPYTHITPTNANAESYERGWNDAIDAIMSEADTIEERKKGKWTMGADMPPMRYRNGKPKKFWPSFRYCSVCGHEAFDDSDCGEQLFAWCPYCGADMREA